MKAAKNWAKEVRLQGAYQFKNTEFLDLTSLIKAVQADAYKQGYKDCAVSISKSLSRFYGKSAKIKHNE